MRTSFMSFPGLGVFGCVFLLAEGFMAGRGTRPPTNVEWLSPPFWDRSSSSHGAGRSSTGGSSGSTPPSPWKQQPGESEFAYLKRLQQLASSTESLSAVQNTTTSSSTNEASRPTNKSYVRVEEWNEKVYKKTNLTWEEKVQFDGQRHGDRFMQNEILRKNLNYFG